MSEKDFKGFARASTGIEGLDYILGGGFPVNRMYLLEGDPGAGKTTMALQFLLAGARNGEPGVYATLSETEEELRDVAASHGWSLDGVTICELQTAEESLKADSQYTLFHPSEVELSARPEVALIDIGLPGLDGNEVARRIRSVLSGSEISLIAMTGYGQPEDRRRALQAGFDRYLVKPVDPAVLAQLLNEAHNRGGTRQTAAFG